MAAFEDGHHAQAFPSFGSERTGAPVVSYCRIRDTSIRSREPVLEPDLIIVQDPTLLPIMDVFSGLKPNGFGLINSAKPLAELGLKDLEDSYAPGHIVAIPAADIAREHLGRPLPNAVLLGGVSALTQIVRLESVLDAIGGRFSGKVAAANQAAAKAAYDLVSEMKEQYA